MMNFDNKFFQKFEFRRGQTEKYLKAATRDLKIARRSDIPEVVFKFCYDALIKSGIALISSFGFRVKSRSGHHIKILEKTALILKDKDIYLIGNRMRKKRNMDLYEGGIFISEKEAKEYLKWIEGVFSRTGDYLSKNIKIF